MESNEAILEWAQKHNELGRVNLQRAHLQRAHPQQWGVLEIRDLKILASADSWCSDNIITCYCKLLQHIDPNTYICDTFFWLNMNHIMGEKISQCQKKKIFTTEK